jgi:hypothetical protein
MEVPEPVRITEAWQGAMALANRTYPGIEVNIIAVPNMSQRDDEPAWMLATYVELGDVFTKQCDHLMAHLVSEPSPPPWVAHCGAAFQVVEPARAMTEVTIDAGDLQQRALSGDDAVKEILAVTIVTTDSVILQSFTLPLIEPLDDPHVNGHVGGHVIDTLRLMMTVLHGEG